MKKTFFMILAAAMALGLVSCKKDDSVTPLDGGETTPSWPTYQEGVYAPLMKVASIKYTNGTSQTWTWSGEMLTAVSGSTTGSHHFTYSNGRVSQVSGNLSGSSWLSGSGTTTYTYDGNQLKECTMTRSGEDVAIVTFKHANGKVSGMDIAMDASYISDLINGLFSTFSGKQTDPKAVTLTSADSCMHLKYVWEGDNVKRVVSRSVFPFEISKDMFDAISPYLPIDESITSMLNIYFMLYDAIPMSVNINDTTVYTYDNKVNPYYCYLGELDAANFSLNNVLTKTTTGSISIALNILQSSMQLYSIPTNDSEQYQYQYNDKNYPTTVSGSESYTITYKE